MIETEWEWQDVVKVTQWENERVKESECVCVCVYTCGKKRPVKRKKPNRNKFGKIKDKMIQDCFDINWVNDITYHPLYASVSSKIITLENLTNHTLAYQKPILGWGCAMFKGSVLVPH